MLVETLVRFQNKEYSHDKFDMAIITRSHRTSGIKEAMAVKIEMKELTDESVPIEPLLTLNRDEAQSILDNLWELGLRPKDAGSVDGELRATRAHLTDLRDMNALMLRAICGYKPLTDEKEAYSQSHNSQGMARSSKAPAQALPSSVQP